MFAGASHITYFLLLLCEWYHQNHVQCHIGRNLGVHPSDAFGWQLVAEVLQEVEGCGDQQLPKLSPAQISEF